MSEVETLPVEAEETQIAPIEAASFLSQKDVETELRKAELMIQFMDKAKVIALRITNDVDWVDLGGKPYLQEMGAQKIAGVFGIDFKDASVKKDVISDDKGTYVVFTAKVTAVFKGRNVETEGTGSSRDAFFSRRAGEDLPLEEINLTNVQKKALSNAYGRAIKRIIGLNPTWEEVKSGIAGEVKAKVSYAGAATKTAEKDDDRVAIGNMLLEITNGDKDSAADHIEEMTQFETKEGKTVKGKRSARALTDKQVPHVLKKVEALHESWMSHQGGE